jgi:hypothetical protein
MARWITYMAGFEDQGLAEVPTLDYSDGGADTVASPVASGGSTRSLRLDASTEAVSLPLASVNKLSLSNTVGAIGFKAYFTDVTVTLMETLYFHCAGI